MLTSQFALIIISLVIAFAGFAIYIWAVKSGQFEDMEETKYDIFDEEDDQSKDENPPS